MSELMLIPGLIRVLIVIFSSNFVVRLVVSFLALLTDSSYVLSPISDWNWLNVQHESNRSYWGCSRDILLESYPYFWNCKRIHEFFFPITAVVEFKIFSKTGRRKNVSYRRETNEFSYVFNFVFFSVKFCAKPLTL